jgi:hypothetical protein
MFLPRFTSNDDRLSRTAVAFDCEDTRQSSTAKLVDIACAVSAAIHHCQAHAHKASIGTFKQSVNDKLVNTLPDFLPARIALENRCLDAPRFTASSPADDFRDKGVILHVNTGCNDTHFIGDFRALRWQS